ncbi:MAG TPA: four-carbon acid sugar kinase family protein [Steroidobacteraceae bacterium]|nr:four-carbon acid sugar kinase family protein [Steroidobacteraceae bacterium]
MEPRWFIIADDLTGAADTASAFARRRLPATVVWGEETSDSHPDLIALAYDAGTREFDAVEAARRHRDALHRFLRPGMHVYKKIDSTLRGNPAEEVAAMLDVLLAQQSDARVVLTTAFPALRRTVRDGLVHVHGIALPFTEFWPEERDPELANLVNMLESAGVHSRLLSLSSVRSDPAALSSALARVATSAGRPAVTVCDAETTDDLERIATASLDAGVTCFVGSAGLAHALAKWVARNSMRRITTPMCAGEKRGALVVVGSRASASRAALSPVLALPNVFGISVQSSMLSGDLQSAAHAEIAQRVAAKLASGVDVVVDISQTAAGAGSDARLVTALASLLAPLARQASALVVTGGETAAAVLTRAGVSGIRLVDEIEPGIPLGLTLGEISVPAVTKAGGFGNEECLKRIVSRLRFIRQTGAVA